MRILNDCYSPPIEVGEFSDNSVKDAETFLAIVGKCGGDVILKSQYGDTYNLKSKLAQYVAVAALVGEYGEELELWCSDKEDEAKFIKMFNEHPELV